MKTKKIIYTVAGVILLSLSACSDFLDPKSQSEYVPQNANALQEMLLGSAYPKPKDNLDILAFMDFFSDDIQLHKTDYEFDNNTAYRTEALKSFFTWQPDMFFTSERTGYGLFNIWESYYKYILGANAALDYINDVSGTEAEKDYVKAQALGLRGFYYFLLVNHFGAPYNYNKDALGVPLKLNSNLLPEDQILMARNTVEEVYTQVLLDLNEAERLFLSLPKDKQYQPNYMINLPMIELLKSRIFLYMENWEDAAIYANKVINDWEFTLLNLNTIPEPTDAIPYYNFTSIKSPEVIWLYGRVGDLTAHYGTTNVVKIESGWSGDVTYLRKAFNTSDVLLNSFQPGDLRKDLYIVKEYDTNNSEFFEDAYTPFAKYNISPKGVPDGDENFALAFRLSEAYLNLAEASAHNNAEGAALKAMSTLLQNRYLPVNYTEPSGLTGDALIAFIQKERQKELCFEGHRWFDLRRYGMPQITRTWEGEVYTLRHNDKSYTMPIPDEVLRKNKKLEQNPLAPKREN